MKATSDAPKQQQSLSKATKKPELKKHPPQKTAAPNSSTGDDLIPPMNRRTIKTEQSTFRDHLFSFVVHRST